MSTFLRHIQFYRLYVSAYQSGEKTRISRGVADLQLALHFIAMSRSCRMQLPVALEIVETQGEPLRHDATSRRAGLKTKPLSLW